MDRAALFDIDGLLVDSETLGTKVFRQVLADNGIHISLEEAERYFVGRNDIDSYKNVLLEKELDFDIDRVLESHFSIYERELLNVSELPGARQIVRKCHRYGYKIAAVSGSTLYQVRIVLDKLDVRNVFSEIVACDSSIDGKIIRGKPAPDGYLEAAKRLEISIENCLVFEDSKSGIIAGKTAGAYVIGVHGTGNQDISQADFQVTSLQEITDHFLDAFKR